MAASHDNPVSMPTLDQYLASVLESVPLAKHAGDRKLMTVPHVRRFVEHLIKEIHKALRNKRLGNRGHNFLLPGPRGVSKSTLLKGLRSALSREQHRVVTFHKDMSAVASRPAASGLNDHPLQQLADRVGFTLTRNICDDEEFDLALADICKYLRSHQLHLLILVDEYQSIFLERRADLVTWRRLYYRIPDFHQITAVLTGSSVYLYDLAYGRMTVHSKFPGYTGSAMRLDDQRYLSHNYNPLEVSAPTDITP